MVARVRLRLSFDFLGDVLRRWIERLRGVRGSGYSPVCALCRFVFPLVIETFVSLVTFGRWCLVEYLSAGHGESSGDLVIGKMGYTVDPVALPVLGAKVLVFVSLYALLLWLLLLSRYWVAIQII